MEHTAQPNKTLKNHGPSSVDDFIRASLEKQFSAFKPASKNGGLHPFFMNLMERQLISVVMEKTGGNQSLAADILGINRNTLRKKIGEHKIKVAKKAGAGKARPS